jgi:hypothetical protein
LRELKSLTEILPIAYELLNSGLEVTEGKVRLLGLSFSHLSKQDAPPTNGSGMQLEMDF